MGAHDSPALFSSLILVDPVLIPEGYDRSAVLPGMVLAAVARRDTWSSRCVVLSRPSKLDIPKLEHGAGKKFINF